MLLRSIIMLTLETELHRVDVVAFSPCGRYLAAGGLGVELWNLGFDRVWRWGWGSQANANARVNDLAFVANGEYLCGLVQSHPHLPGNFFALQMLNAEDIQSPNSSDTTAIAGLSHSTRVYCVGPTRLRSWHITRRELPSDDQQSWDNRTRDINAIACSPMHPLLAHVSVTLYESALRFFDPATGNSLQSIPCAYRHLDNLAYSLDGQFVVSRRENMLLVWPVDELKYPPRRLVNDTRKALTDVAFHPDGRLWATASNDRIVKLWDTRVWQPIREFDWHGGRMRSIAFSPDGCLAAAGTDQGYVVLFDVDL